MSLDDQKPIHSGFAKAVTPPPRAAAPASSEASTAPPSGGAPDTIHRHLGKVGGPAPDYGHEYPNIIAPGGT